MIILMIKRVDRKVCCQVSLIEINIALNRGIDKNRARTGQPIFCAILLQSSAGIKNKS
jgi:hypothetical protein